MRKLINDTPLTRITWPYVWWDNWFSEEELASITEFCDSQGLDQVKGSTTPEGINSAANIKAKTHYLTDENRWFFQRLNHLIDEVDTKFYQMDLVGYESFTYTVHEGAGITNMVYRDMLFGESMPRDQHLTRKLTCILMLSDRSEYDGGELEIYENINDPISVNHKKGRLVALPSYVYYGIRPLASGIRKTIDIQVLGPKFK